MIVLYTCIACNRAALKKQKCIISSATTSLQQAARQGTPSLPNPSGCVAKVCSVETHAKNAHSPPTLLYNTYVLSRDVNPVLCTATCLSHIQYIPQYYSTAQTPTPDLASPHVLLDTNRRRICIQGRTKSLNRSRYA